MDEQTEYKDIYYMKKNKCLCKYCSYRCAVPSKNNEYCSEMCRLLHFSITKNIDLEDIGKLIKLNKVDLINIILTLKQIKISKKEICEEYGLKYEPPNVFKMNNNGGVVHFD